jgi:C4-dicarboxylate-specific signal transduction histidine kinase
MMSEVVITFYQKTKASFVAFYEARDLSVPMIQAGKDAAFTLKQDSDKCYMKEMEDFFVIILPLRSSYMKFIYSKESDISYIFEMICGFSRKINFALSACAGVKELEEFNDELEERVREGVNKIREHENMLLVQSKSAIMGEMLEMIAHQWRQPITSIGMISNNMLFSIVISEDEPLDKPQFQSELEDINKQIKYLSHTIDDFRNFFKESKTRQEIYMDDIVIKSISLLSKQFEQNSIAIEVKNGCQNTLLYTYKNELTQVLLNILHNSKDAFESCRQENKKIAIDCSKKDDEITIEINDNAGGIEESILQKIFEPYFSTKKEKNGTGLGLYMSRIIVTKHLQGEIEAKNSKDGASFIIRMPILKKSEELFE